MRRQNSCAVIEMRLGRGIGENWVPELKLWESEGNITVMLCSGSKLLFCLTPCRLRRDAMYR